MNRRFALAVVACWLLALACNLGPFWRVTVTPPPPATSSPTVTGIPTLTPASTDTSTAAATATATETLTPTAVTCPKGTILRPSENACYYATRTPKRNVCLTYKKASECKSNGCKWDKTTGTCGP